MLIKYPNGSVYTNSTSTNKKIIKIKKKNFNAANRGMLFEKNINESNDFYIKNNIAVITKRPTPIKIVKVDFAKKIITNAFFEKPSTTDYNGVYKGYYLDFEAKSTQNKNSFPIKNITVNQIRHLKRVNEHKGIAFFLIQFARLNEVYFLDAKYVIDFYEKNKKKSIPINDIRKNGFLVTQKYQLKYSYLDIVDKYIKN